MATAMGERERASCGLSEIPGSEIAFSPSTRPEETQQQQQAIYSYLPGTDFHGGYLYQRVYIFPIFFFPPCVQQRGLVSLSSALCPIPLEEVLGRGQTERLNAHGGDTHLTTQCPGKSLISYPRPVAALATSTFLPVPSFVHHSARTNYSYNINSGILLVLLLSRTNDFLDFAVHAHRVCTLTFNFQCVRIRGLYIRIYVDSIAAYIFHV